MDNLIQLIGRLHPLIVHLPIGILMLAVGLHILIALGRFAAYRSFLPLIWFLGCMSSVMACVAGYGLSLGGDYASGAVDIHMWSGIALVVFSGAVYFMLRRNAAAIYQLAGVIVSGILLITTGHWGGNLTHGSDYLTEPLYALIGMESDKEQRPPITDIREALVYQDLVQPILESKCYNCHGSTKQKGSLRLDTQDAILDGGEHGKVIIPGKAKESPLFASLILPVEHDDHMPPEGKPQLTENEIALIEWWLDHGKATFTGKVAEIERNDKMKAMLASFTAEEKPAEVAAADEEKKVLSEIPSVKVKKADPQLMQQLKKMGVAFTPLTADHVFLAANLVNNPHFNDNDIQKLLKIKDQLIWLDLSGTSVTDKGLKALGSFPHLTRLTLDNTAVTDVGLSYLKSLPLQYLNLYGTNVTDAGLKALADCEHLRKLYLWKTATTPEGIAALEKTLKGEIEIVAAANFK